MFPPVIDEATMARFGKNPFGENLWRIVWAPSRRTLAIDPLGEHSHVRIYRQIGERWVLERWITAWEFCQCSERAWNEGPGRVLGPYPARGMYQHAFTFDVPVQDCNLDKLIAWIEAGRMRSWQDHLDACKSEYEREEKDASNTRQAIIRNALPAFGTAPVTGYGGGSGTKTKELPLSARGWQPKPGIERKGGAEHKMIAVRGK